MFPIGAAHRPAEAVKSRGFAVLLTAVPCRERPAARRSNVQPGSITAPLPVMNAPRTTTPGCSRDTARW